MTDAGVPVPVGPLTGEPLIPGEVLSGDGPIEVNAGRPPVTLRVENTGDRPVQVGSHFHFAEANPALAFDRAAARGCHLDVPAGTSVRFEPGAAADVAVVPYVGARYVAGFRGHVGGPLDPPGTGAGGDPPGGGR